MYFTRTIPQDETPDWVSQWYDGRQTGEIDVFPLPAVPVEMVQGDWLGLIYRGSVVARFRIIAIIQDQGVAYVGSQDRPINARYQLRVQCPGERPRRHIPREGHPGVLPDSRLEREWWG